VLEELKNFSESHLLQPPSSGFSGPDNGEFFLAYHFPSTYRFSQGFRYRRFAESVFLSVFFGLFFGG